MATVTLADINQTLISVDENTQTTSRGIEGFLKYLEEKRRDDLEAERERKAQRVEVSKQKSDSAGKTSITSPFTLYVALLNSVSFLVY